MSNVIHLRNQRKKKNENRAGKYLLGIAIILAIILLLMTKLFEIKSYEVVGNHLYSNEEIIKMLGINKRSNIIKIYMDTNKDFASYPFIDRFDLEYLSYNKVRINVYEKQIIGYIFYMSNYLCIDKDGYIVDYVKPENLDEKIAIIEGLSSDTLVIGEKIDIPKDYLATCLMFYQAERKYDLNIEIIKFEEQSSRNIVVTIGETNIIFKGLNQFNEKIQSLKDILTHIPPGESGTLYLGEGGTNSFYEKNVE